MKEKVNKLKLCVTVSITRPIKFDYYNAALASIDWQKFSIEEHQKFQIDVKLMMKMNYYLGILILCLFLGKQMFVYKKIV